MLPKYHIRMGYEVTVIASLVSFDHNGKPCLLKSESEYMDKDGFKVIRMDYKEGVFKRINKRLRFYTRTYELLERENPNIIFIHGTSFGDAKYVKKYILNHPEVKIFSDSHSDWFNSARNFLSINVLHRIIWRHYTQMLLPFTEKLYGVLPVRCDFLHRMYGVPKEKIELLPLGVDDEAIPADRNFLKETIRDELGINDSDFVIITGGKINALKNIHKLMEAVNRLNEKNLHLIIFGTVSLDFKAVFEKHLSDNIHFVGWCNSEQIINYMISADLACFPGTHSILWEQAVGLSLPCIFRDWKGMHHFNIDNNCLFLDDDRVESIISAILKIIDKTLYQDVYKKSCIAADSFKYSTISRKSIGLC